MNHRAVASSFDAKAYQLPHKARVCGHLAAGRPCPIGPDGNGECHVQSVCEPWHDGTQWHCTRAKAFGGRCPEGPIPGSHDADRFARCPHQYASCQPARSLRSKRRLVTALTACAALGVCLVMLGGSSGDFSDSIAGTSPIISPGPLSAHHATMHQGCSACHSAATQSPTDLVSCAFGGSGSIDESHKCLKCHRQFGEHALQPHSVSPARLLVRTQQSSGHHTTGQMLSRLLATHNTTQSGQLACSTCHQEHQGAAFELSAMTNAQCQSCHASTFESFSDGHPEFSGRPRADLYFNHVTHMNLHFQNFERLMPHGKARMQCSDCHVPDSGGVMMELASFQVMCASCHGPQIRDYDQLPSARLHELAFINGDIKPSDHIAVPPFMELMLANDSNGPETVTRLVQSLAMDGEETLRRQLHMICDQSTDSATIEACVAALEESRFFDAVAVLNRAMESEGERNDVVYGNWRLPANSMKLVYDCRTHADPVLRTWIDLLAHNARQYPKPPAPDDTGIVDRFLRDVVAPESTGRCLKCHSIDEAGLGEHTVNWSSQHGRSASRGFTRFSHKPHLTLLSSDVEAHAVGNGHRCETCHALSENSFDLVSPAFVMNDGMPNPIESQCSAVGVNSSHRENCAQCHTKSLAGDNCLQCHNYHVHETADVRPSPQHRSRLVPESVQ